MKGAIKRRFASWNSQYLYDVSKNEDHSVDIILSPYGQSCVLLTNPYDTSEVPMRVSVSVERSRFDCEKADEQERGTTYLKRFRFHFCLCYRQQDKQIHKTGDDSHRTINSINKQRVNGILQAYIGLKQYTWIGRDCNRIPFRHDGF